MKRTAGRPAAVSCTKQYIQDQKSNQIKTKQFNTIHYTHGKATTTIYIYYNDTLRSI